MKTFTLFLTLLFVTNCTFAEKKWPKVYDSSNSKWIDLEEVEEILQKQRVVFVGEKHGHRWGHRVERMLLEMYWNVRGDVTVGMEMFERDTQHVLDGYVRGEVSEEFLMRNTRPWKNYKTDYRPLVEFAKDMRLSVLAMNAPRRYASFVAKNKEEILFAMPNKEQTFMAQKITAPKDLYLEKFKEAMRGMPDSMISSYYRAQCFKDNTMAKSMAVLLAMKPRTNIIAYMGSFHSDSRLGTVQRFSAMVPRVKPLVISIIPVESENIEDVEQYKSLGDLIFFAPENLNKTKGPTSHPHTKGKNPVNPHTKGKVPVNPHTKGKNPVNPHTKGKNPVNPHTKGKNSVNPHTKGKNPVNPHTKGKVPVNPHTKEKTPANPHTSEETSANTQTEEKTSTSLDIKKEVNEKTAENPHTKKEVAKENADNVVEKENKSQTKDNDSREQSDEVDNSDNKKENNNKEKA
ncbi:ChaN family lipoprotein [Candidatus Uabimicrobium sp. HlEnr_7]|uniref:ChaN family lipoprotein n=1 Tax=Candidatus Uabimicrobium helgolandensis TaxID=3095367 RepID=UPI003557F5EF